MCCSDDVLMQSKCAKYVCQSMDRSLSNVADCVFFDYMRFCGNNWNRKEFWWVFIYCDFWKTLKCRNHTKTRISGTPYTHNSHNSLSLSHIRTHIQRLSVFISLSLLQHSFTHTHSNFINNIHTTHKFYVYNKYIDRDRYTEFRLFKYFPIYFLLI